MKDSGLYFEGRIRVTSVWKQRFSHILVGKTERGDLGVDEEII